MVFFIVECRKRVNGRANPLPMSLAERRGEEERREEMCPIYSWKVISNFPAAR